MGRAGGKIMQLQFAGMVKEAKKVGLSQAKLGKKIGVWNTYVGQIEKGEKVPSDEKVGSWQRSWSSIPIKFSLWPTRPGQTRSKPKTCFSRWK